MKCKFELISPDSMPAKDSLSRSMDHIIPVVFAGTNRFGSDGAAPQKRVAPHEVVPLIVNTNLQKTPKITRNFPSVFGLHTSNSELCKFVDGMLNIKASFQTGLQVPFLQLDFFFLMRLPLAVR